MPPKKSASTAPVDQDDRRRSNSPRMQACRDYFSYDTAKTTYTCTFEGCGFSRVTRNVHKDRFWRHLSDHHSTEPAIADAMVAAAANDARPLRQRTLAFPTNVPDAIDRLVRMIAKNGLSFRLLEDDDFKWILERAGMAICRKVLVTRLKNQALVDFAFVCENFFMPTLCIDVGTVGQRYIVFAIVERGLTAVVGCVCDKEMADGRMTIPSIESAVREVIVQLQAHDVFPLSIVADNASNMQGLRRSTAAPATAWAAEETPSGSASDEADEAGPQDPRIKELHELFASNQCP